MKRPNREFQPLPSRPGDGFVPFPRAALEQSIGARFDEQVRIGPQRLAVSFETEMLTYAELHSEARRIAGALLERHIAPGSPVAILARQGPGLIAAILGVLKSGGMYLPLDPTRPVDFLRSVVDDAGPAALLADGHDRELSRALCGSAVPVLFPEDWINSAKTTDPEAPVSPKSGAALYYTSGSTGRPKGVVQTHVSILHNVLRYTQAMRIAPNDRCSLLQSCMFSGSISTLFSALLNGAALFLYDLTTSGTAALADWTRRNAISVFHSVPALFRELAASGGHFPNIRLIRLEGDLATRRDAELFQSHFSEHCVLSHGLGTTETGLVCRYLLRLDDPLPRAFLPVGWNVDGMETLILDSGGNPLRPGSSGEICVRSAYLAAGYWGRPDETAKAFLTDPGGDGVRVYRTGDLGRLLPDGCLEHLGRVDSRVRIAGQWVDLADVEGALLGCPEVDAAAVVLRADHPDEPRLVAYMVAAASTSPSPAAMRRRLTERLPSHAIPSDFLFLESLPLTAHGKLDRRSLPPPGRRRPQLDTPFTSAASPAETALAALFADVLCKDPIGIHDSFLELGGSSILALRLLARIRAKFGVEVPLPRFFDEPTVAGLARIFEERSLTR